MREGPFCDWRKSEIASKIRTACRLQTAFDLPDIGRPVRGLFGLAVVKVRPARPIKGWFA